MSHKKTKGRLLTSSAITKQSDYIPLADIKPVAFKISVEHSLDNNYEFKDIKPAGVKDLHHFIEETIGKNLNISEVETLFLRKKGLKKSMITEKVDGGNREIIHLGKDRHPFRVHGYYKKDYFVLTKIDCSHDVHKT